MNLVLVMYDIRNPAEPKEHFYLYAAFPFLRLLNHQSNQFKTFYSKLCSTFQFHSQSHEFHTQNVSLSKLSSMRSDLETLFRNN